MDAIEAIKSRVSVRRFTSEAIPKAVLEDIADCGRLAPSGYNRQDWVFVLVTDRELLRRIAAETAYGLFIAEAAACAAVFQKKDGVTPVEDACAATENMIIAARAYGIGSCWVNSHRKEHSAAVSLMLGCPDGYELITLLALGYPAQEKRPPKKPLTEVLRYDHF